MKRKDSYDSDDFEIMLIPLDDFIYKVVTSMGNNLENHIAYQKKLMSDIIKSNMEFQNAISLLPEYEKLDNLSEMDKQKIGDLKKNVQMFQALFEGEMKQAENGIDYKSILLNFGYIPHVNIANKNDNSINSVNAQIDVLNKTLQQLINKELSFIDNKLREIIDYKNQDRNDKNYYMISKLFELQNDIDEFKNKYPKIIQFTKEQNAKLDIVPLILKEMIVSLQKNSIDNNNNNNNNNNMNANSFYSYNQWISKIKNLSQNPKFQNNKKMIDEFIININEIANKLDEINKQKINDNKNLVEQMQNYKEAASLGNMEFPESIFQVNQQKPKNPIKK